MDSAPSNSIGASQLSKFDNYIMDFQNLGLNFYRISLKTSWKISPFHLTIRLHLHHHWACSISFLSFNIGFQNAINSINFIAPNSTLILNYISYIFKFIIFFYFHKYKILLIMANSFPFYLFYLIII